MIHPVPIRCGLFGDLLALVLGFGGLLGPCLNEILADIRREDEGEIGQEDALEILGVFNSSSPDFMNEHRNFVEMLLTLRWRPRHQTRHNADYMVAGGRYFVNDVVIPDLACDVLNGVATIVLVLIAICNVLLGDVILDEGPDSIRLGFLGAVVGGWEKAESDCDSSADRKKFAFNCTCENSGCFLSLFCSSVADGNCLAVTPVLKDSTGRVEYNP